jgi:hypothetical protein
MVLSRRVGSGIHQPLSKLHLTNFFTYADGTGY